MRRDYREGLRDDVNDGGQRSWWSTLAIGLDPGGCERTGAGVMEQVLECSDDRIEWKTIGAANYPIIPLNAVA
jgi:hypothetical protein